MTLMMGILAVPQSLVNVKSLDQLETWENVIICCFHQESYALYFRNLYFVCSYNTFVKRGTQLLYRWEILKSSDLPKTTH